MWDHRNEALHKLSNRSSEIHMVDLDKAVRSLYNKAVLKLQRSLDRYLVWRPLRQVLWLDRDFKTAWVRATLVALQHEKTRHDKERRDLAFMRRIMYCWLRGRNF
jgi:hypothetical protein